MYWLLMFRANVKGSVSGKSIFLITLSKWCCLKLQLNLKTPEFREINWGEIIKAEVCGTVCIELVLLQYKACAARGCLFGRCQQQNIVIELPKYPENVFLFVIR